ncbi:MAG: DUF2029 domain-containing protein [Phycisphaerae bacterium]|jgi:hypothetical protein
MSVPAPANGPWGRPWRALAWASAAYAVLVAGIAAERAPTTSDFRDYWENAVHFLQTGEISAELGVHNYLPAFTILMAPWGLLPLRAAAFLFVLLSIALFGGTVVLAERVLHPDAPARPQAATLLAIALLMPYVTSCAVLGQVGLAVGLLVMLGWRLAQRRRTYAAGAAIGLAALLKIVPAAVLAYFVLRGARRLVLAAAAVVIGLGLGLPLLVLGETETILQHRQFFERAVLGQSAVRTLLDEQPDKALYSNNSLPIVLRRLLSPVSGSKDADGAPRYVNVADVPRERILAAYAAIATGVLLATVAVTLPARRRIGDAGSRDGGDADDGCFAVWLCAALLASPLLWTHYLVWMYWPLRWLAGIALDGNSPRVSRALVWLAMLAWLAGCIALAFPPARAAGAQLFSVFVVWLGVVVVLAAQRRGAAAPT